MAASHLILFVEEPSMEAFVRTLLPRVLPPGRTFEVRVHQGKADLLNKLEVRLRALARCIPADCCVLVLLDRDDDDCRMLKGRMDAIAERAGLTLRGRAGQGDGQLINRIAIEELESWYFGDWEAVRAEYPRLPAHTPERRGLRDPDAIAGGTWETFERLLQKHGYFKGGLRKIEAARRIAAHIVPDRNRSASFRAFHAALMEALA